MRKMWTVKGFAAEYGSDNMLVVEAREDDRPVMMEVCGTMMDYIYEVGGTDKEEKYADKIFVYDSSCSLEAVIVPSTNEHLPAKVIIYTGHDNGSITFGAQDIIDTTRPEPMPWEDWKAAYEYTRNHEDYDIRNCI